MLLSLRQDPIFLRAAPHSPAEVTPFENSDAKLAVHLYSFRKCKSSALRNFLSSYEFILLDLAWLWHYSSILLVVLQQWLP